MRTVRRIYFYAVTLVSLEIVLWGLIGLARSVFCREMCGVGVALAEALALVLVGVPVFGFHWIMAQRFAGKDMEERASGVRAAFLYGVLLGTLIPALQNLLALVNRPVLSAFQLRSSQAFVGGGQVWSDNIIAIVMNLLVAAYFFTVLRLDWKIIQPKEDFVNLRRIYRWIWTLYGLGLTVAGLDQVLRFILSINTGLMSLEFQQYWAVNGIVVTLVGAPVWAYAWLTIQKSLAEQAERESFLRLGLLYLLSLTGAIVTLSTSGAIVNSILQAVFGGYDTFLEFIQAIDGPLAACIPFLGIWLYYGHWLGRAMREVPDAPRRDGMRRLYFYILSALGLTVAFLGLAMLLSYLLEVLKGFYWYTSGQPLDQLTAALALLVVGLPLWLLTWRPMQAEAFSLDAAGDHARRSILRKIYLYLTLFASVIGGMIIAVILLYNVLKAMFEGDVLGLAWSTLHSFVNLFLFVGLGLYHGLMLGRDNRTTANALATRHAAFPVLVFDPGDGFGAALLAAIQKQAPRLPVSLQTVDQPVAAEASPQAVVLPSDLAFTPTESLRNWLAGYKGHKVVVPRPAQGWTVVGQPARLPDHQAALTVRQLAEGQEVRAGGIPGWQIGVYIIAALAGLPVLLGLISLIITLVSAASYAGSIY